AIASQKVTSAIEDYQGSDQARARKGIEETSEWLKEKSERLKVFGEKQIDFQIKMLDTALDKYGQRLPDLIKIRSDYDTQLQQYKEERSGLINNSTHAFDQWRGKFKNIYDNIIDKSIKSLEYKYRLKKFLELFSSHNSIIEVFDGEELHMSGSLFYKKEKYMDEMKKLKEDSYQNVEF